MAEVETTVGTPKPKTIIVHQTTKPPLIPDENATAWCFTRRNMFDAVIALAIAGVVIYFVMGMRGGRSMSLNPFGSSSGSSAFGRMAPAGVRTQGMRPGVDISGIGQQIAGAIKKFFR